MVLIHGPDAQALDDALALVTRALLPDASAAAFDREVLEGATAEPEAVVSAALTLPVMARARLVAVRRAQALPPRGADVLARYAAKPNPAACLLLLADEALGPSRERRAPHWLLGAVPASATVALEPRRGRAAEEWLRQRAAAEGLTVTDEAARLLVQFAGEDPATLLGEARKAALAGGPDNRSVGVDEVTAVVGEHRVSGVFDLIRAIERRDAGLALRTLDRLLATEEPIAVLAMLTREVRTRLTVRAWRERGQPTAQIARMLGRPPAVVESLAAAALAEAPAGLARKLERCWEVERRLKSGGEPGAEMAALVADLCAGGG